MDITLEDLQDPELRARLKAELDAQGLPMHIDEPSVLAPLARELHAARLSKREPDETAVPSVVQREAIRDERRDA